MGETITLSYRELADRLGISFDAAKSRARRAGWPKIRGNDDAIRLLIPFEYLQSAEVRLPRADTGDTPEQPTHVDTPTDTALSALTAALNLAHQRADEAIQRTAQTEAQIALANASANYERTRAETAEKERDALKERLDRPGIAGRLIRFLF